MTGTDRTDDAAGSIDPWAPGGAMASVPPATSAQLSFDAVETSSPPRRPPRQRWLLGGVALLAVGVVVAVGWSLRDDDPSADPIASDVGVASLPTEPSATSAIVPEPTAPQPTPRPTPPPLLADPRPPVPTPVQQLQLAEEPREFVIDVALELADINPTEVVALRGNGELIEVSLPSGRVRATSIGFDAGRARLAVNDGGTVVWPTPAGGAFATGTSGAVTLFDGLIDAVSWTPGTLEMYLWTFSPATDGPAVQRVTLEHREIDAEPAHWVDIAAGPEPFVDFDGALLRRDTGGTYRLGPAGVELLTTGDVVASGPNHLLLRECDAARSCSLVSLGSAGERTEWRIDLPADLTPQQVGGLSPGGDALLVYTDRIAPNTARSMWVLELTDGTTHQLRTPNTEAVAAWDTTGTGIFLADPALLYIDRFTGRTVVVSADLNALGAIATRRPLATPICEVLAIALPQFDAMAAGGDDNTIPPPPEEVLNRIVPLAPDELGTQVAALIIFVAGFVSAEVPGSQTVANWPADVRAGLDALDGYAANQCPLIAQ